MTDQIFKILLCVKRTHKVLWVPTHMQVNLYVKGKFMRKIIITCTLAIVLVTLSGCGLSEEETKVKNEIVTHGTTNDTSKELTETKPNTPYGFDNSVYSFSFRADGTVYTLPSTLQTFLDDGWTLESRYDVLPETIPPNDFLWTKTLHRNDFTVDVSLRNDTSETLPLNECKVYTVESHILESGYFINNAVEFPLGITGHNTVDDVIKTWGEPDARDDLDGGRIRLTYLQSNDSTVIFADKATGTIHSIVTAVVSRDPLDPNGEVDEITTNDKGEINESK